MSERLDDLFTSLRVAPTDRSLDDLDAEIGRSVLLHRRDVRNASALGSVRLVSVGIALAAGLTSGGAVATTLLTDPQPYAAFSTHANLAPSTLLEGTK